MFRQFNARFVSKVSIFSILTAAAMFVSSASALEQPAPKNAQDGIRLDKVVKQIEGIEKTQEEILADQEAILEQIKNLKVWSHKN